MDVLNNIILSANNVEVTTISLKDSGTKIINPVVIVSAGGESSKDMLQTVIDSSHYCYGLFQNYPSDNIDFIKKLDTRNVTSMDYMFKDCTSLTTIPPLNTRNVTGMSSMFSGCEALTTIPPLNTSNVTSMDYMFCNCASLTTIPSLDTSNVETMEYMFAYCESLTTVPPLNASNVIDMTEMFSGCTSLTTISSLDTSNVENMYYMFAYCMSLTTIPPLDTSNVTDMSYMFVNCESLTTIPSLDTRNVEYMHGMFDYCTALTNLTLLNIKAHLRIGSGNDWGTLLTLDSLLNTIKELIDTGSSLTLTMGSANLDKIANVYVKLTGEAEEDEALPKLPFVVCESTDEGAMLIADYVQLKNWNLA